MASSRKRGSRDVISAKDRREIEKFEQYLRDKKTMPPEALLRKHQRYLSLTDDQLEQQINIAKDENE